jgi:regulatory protein
MSFSQRKRAYDQAALYEYAVNALARRMRSVAELKRLLRQRVAGQSDGEELVEAVVLKLKDQHYLDDSRYAAAYSSYRRENEKFGSLRVVRGLKSRGVHGEIIAKAVRAAYAGVNEEKLAREYLARKRMSKPANDREAAKVFRALARAGFASATIFAILRKWRVDGELISLLEEQDSQSIE